MNGKTGGGVWKRTNQYGEYLFISVEINGQKYTFYGNKNEYKKSGDKRPDFTLKPTGDWFSEPSTSSPTKEDEEAPF